MRKLRYASMILAGWLSLLSLSGYVHEFPEETGPETTAVKCYIHLRYDLGSMPLLTTVPYNENGAKTRSATTPIIPEKWPKVLPNPPRPTPICR